MKRKGKKKKKAMEIKSPQRQEKIVPDDMSDKREVLHRGTYPKSVLPQAGCVFLK